MAQTPHDKLLSRALDFLRRRALSRFELATRLAPHADPSEVGLVLDRLVELNLLNDGEYAYNFAFYRLFRKGWGPLKVRNELLRRQVDPKLIESALDRVLQERDVESLLADYLERHCGRNGWPGDRRQLRRLISHLRSRGFPEEFIYRILKHRIPAVVWRGYENGE